MTFYAVDRRRQAPLPVVLDRRCGGLHDRLGQLARSTGLGSRTKRS
jgi:hypothetical protein